MGETVTLVSAEDRESKNGKPYTLAKDGNGRKMSIWEQDVRNAVKSIVPGKAKIETRTKDGFTTITAAEAVDLPPTKTPEGETNWDVIGLYKTRCSLWNAYLREANKAVFAHAFQKSDTRIPSAAMAEYVLEVGRFIVEGAEQDIFRTAAVSGTPEQAEDDGIPFD